MAGKKRVRFPRGAISVRPAIRWFFDGVLVVHAHNRDTMLTLLTDTMLEGGRVAGPFRGDRIQWRATMQLLAVYRVEEEVDLPGAAPQYGTLVWQLARDLRHIMLGFGTGHFAEVRVVGESARALDYFRVYITRGGYPMTDTPHPSTTLFTAGDEIYGGFIFVDPRPRPERFLS